MSSRKTFLVSAALLVVTAILVMLLVPARSRLSVSEGGSGPAEVVLTGILRDFRGDHPDFGVIPEVGTGHSVGNAGRLLDLSRRPSYLPDGSLVEDEYRDSAGREIAPHLYQVIPGPGGGAEGRTIGVRVDGDIEVKDEALIDAFSSAAGPYGSLGNYGPGAFVSTNSTENHAVKVDKKAGIYGDVLVGPGGLPGEVIDADGVVTGAQGTLDEPYPMPAIDVPDPEDLGPYQDHVHIEGPADWIGDLDPDDDTSPPIMNFGKLHIKEDADITVHGDVVIYCSHDLDIDKSRITLLDDATLTFFVTGDHDIEFDRAEINLAGPDTTAVTVHYLGDKKIKLKKTHLYGTLFAPYGTLELKDDGHLYGGYVGRELKLDKRSGLHVDTGNVDPSSINPAITVWEKIEIKDNAEVDGFDSNLGPWGPGNSGAEALLITNTVKHDKVKVEDHSTVTGDVIVGAGGSPASVIKLDNDSEITGIMGSMAAPRPIPVVAPPNLGPRTDDEVKYEGGTHTIASNLRCKKLKLKDRAILLVEGDVTILCDDKLEMEKKSEIRLQPGATLAIYFKKELEIEEDCLVNANTGNPQLCSIYRMSLGGKGKVKVKKRSELVAWVQGAQTKLEIEDHSKFFGTFSGREIKVKKNSLLHVDMAFIAPCVDVHDEEGELGDPTLGGVASASSFDQWFRDVPGTNQSMLHSITMSLGPDGVYAYEDADFHPADGRLFGHEGAAHNHHFTYAIQAYFTYEECAGQFVSFRGGDGAWLYVNNRLVIDLGGVLSGTRQFIDLDRLGLRGGEDYHLGLYYAQRNTTSARFDLRTNVMLDSTRLIPPVTMQYD